MREIKFRVWDIQNERMVYEPYRFDKAWENELALWDAPYYFYEHWQDIDDGIRRACQIMQYTGLKDKNGKEIYEGDIVKCFDHPTGVDSSTGEVYYSQGSWRVKDTVCLLGDFGTAWTEVIGNIYEKEQPTAIVIDLINYSDSTEKISK